MKVSTSNKSKSTVGPSSTPSPLTTFSQQLPTPLWPQMVMAAQCPYTGFYWAFTRHPMIISNLQHSWSPSGQEESCVPDHAMECALLMLHHEQVGSTTGKTLPSLLSKGSACSSSFQELPLSCLIRQAADIGFPKYVISAASHLHRGQNVSPRLPSH